ncbi:MAG: hypothetical protein ABL868_08625, partial [Sulfuriferula sp.]
MLGNLFKAFSKKGAGEQPSPARPATPEVNVPTVDDAVPTLTAATLPVPDSHSIDTNAVDNAATVVAALDIPTYGERNNTAEMTKRFLGRQPVFSTSKSII